MESASAQPRGLTAVGLFLVFGVCMALLAGVTLSWPGSSLDQVWALNPGAYKQLSPFGRLAGLAFLLLAAILGTAAAGWFARRVWAWRLTVGVIVTQILGNLVNMILGRYLEAISGAMIATALLFYLLQARVRAAFSVGSK